MKTIKKDGQQGDVIMRRLDAMPPGEQKIVAKGKCVVAHGESGHTHYVEDAEAELIAIGERMLLKLGRATSLVHDEHHEENYAAGIWEIGRVREHDYFAQMTHPVQD